MKYWISSLRTIARPEIPAGLSRLLLSFIALSLILIATPVLGQLNTGSIYSRYGIGILNNTGNPRHFGLGGISTPLGGSNVINFNNPGTYGSLDRVVFQINGTGSMREISDSLSSSSFNAGRLNEIGFGFKRTGSRWGIVLGLTPLSTAGYSLSTEATLNDSTDVTYEYEGEGGLNRLIIGIGREFRVKADSVHRSFPILGAGLNVNYLFGTTDQTRRVIFDNTEFNNTRIVNSNSYSGFTLNAGIIHQLPLWLISPRLESSKFEHTVYVGADYMLSSDIRSLSTELGQTFYYFSGVEVAIDSSYYIPETRGTLELPSRLSVGIAYELHRKSGGYWTFASDYKQQDWTGRQINAINDDAGTPLTKSSTFSAGIEFRPDVDKATRFVRKLSYRVGVRQTETYLQMRGIHITDEAFSAGMTIPIGGGGSHFSIGVELGTLGTRDFGLVQEDYLGFSVGVSLNPYEPWFIRRRYD